MAMILKPQFTMGVMPTYLNFEEETENNDVTKGTIWPEVSTNRDP
jgi:hypothetical protein